MILPFATTYGKPSSLPTGLRVWQSGKGLGSMRVSRIERHPVLHVEARMRRGLREGGRLVVGGPTGPQDAFEVFQTQTFLLATEHQVRLTGHVDQVHVGQRLLGVFA